MRIAMGDQDHADCPSTSARSMGVIDVNCNKAGMQGLDKETIGRIINQASAGSKFYLHKAKKQERLQEQIRLRLEKLGNIPLSDRLVAEQAADGYIERVRNEQDLSRTFIHVDMDAYYAAVEMRDCPKLRDIPMAVGGESMLSTSNYAARRFGVRAAMPGFIARRLCPSLVIVPCNFEKYKKISNAIREQVFETYDSNVVMGSLDEAYLDITRHLMERTEPSTLFSKRYSGACICWLPRLEAMDASEGVETVSVCEKCGQTSVCTETQVTFGVDAASVAAELRHRVEQLTGLTCSAGIAATRMLAKICSDQNKPNGQFELKANCELMEQFLHSLPIRKVPGIGAVSEALLNALNVQTVGDILNQRTDIWLSHSQLSAHALFRAACGGGGCVEEGDQRDSSRKSISVERTFSQMSTLADMEDMCLQLCEDLAEDVEKKQLLGKNVTLKLKTVEFETLTRSQTLPKYVHRAEELYGAARRILRHEFATTEGGLKLRLMGVRLSSFYTDTAQVSLTHFFKSSMDSPNQANHVAPDLEDDDEQLESVGDEETTRLDETSETAAPSVLSQVESTVSAEHEVDLADGDQSCVDEAEHKPDDDQSSPLIMQCPVCQWRLPRCTSLRSLNDHIDGCLSRAEIRKVVREHSESDTRSPRNGRKRPSVRHAASGSAKRGRTIDSFFKK